MRIGHARPRSALGAAEPVGTRAIFVSVEVSLRGRRTGVKTSPYRGEVGLFSGQSPCPCGTPCGVKIGAGSPPTPVRFWSLRPSSQSGAGALTLTGRALCLEHAVQTFGS